MSTLNTAFAGRRDSSINIAERAAVYAPRTDDALGQALIRDALEQIRAGMAARRAARRGCDVAIAPAAPPAA
jgi:hypothetical protein